MPRGAVPPVAASGGRKRLTRLEEDNYGIVPFNRASSTREDRMADAQGDMDCPDCMDLLADYVDGSLPRHQAELLEWHLEGCGPCVAFVRTYKGTVDAARRLRETTLPPELKEKLRAFLKRSVQQ
jgi:anti-sigma factor RsiW